MYSSNVIPSCLVAINLILARMIYHSVCCLYVTGPVKTGHVDTKYILSHNRSYFSAGTEYLYFVTCSIQPNKHLISVGNFIVMTYQQ